MLETLPSKGQLAILSESPHSGFHALIVEEILREVRSGNQYVPLEDAVDALKSQDHQQKMYIIIIIIYIYIYYSINIVYIYILSWAYMSINHYSRFKVSQNVWMWFTFFNIFFGGTVLPYTYGFKET